MISQQSDQQSGEEPMSQGSRQQLREEPQLSVNKATKAAAAPRRLLKNQNIQRQPANNMAHQTSQLLQQQANAQGGSADPATQQLDEMSSAVEQIRQRHQKDLQRDQLLQAQSQQRQQQLQQQMQMQQQKATSQQQQQSAVVALVKDVTEADNTTEFLLLSLQHCFILKPQQVQQLLQNQNQLLIQACEQGLPVGDFSKVKHFFEFLGQDVIFKKMINQFVKALSQSQEIDVILVLGTIKCGLYSHDENIARICLQLLFRVVEFLRKGNEEYKKRGKPMPVVFDVVFSKWFIKHVPQPEDSFLHNSVLQSVAECVEQHHSLTKEAAGLYLSVFKSEGFKLAQLPELLKEAYSDDIFMLYETMSSLLGDLNKLDRDATKAAAEESTMIQDVLTDATADHGDFALKLKCTNLMIEIWFYYPTIVSMPQKQHLGVGSLSLKDSFHHVLQQGSQERDKVFRINIFDNTFTLLDRLAAKDNSETSSVYSTLISGLLEHYKGKTSDKQIDQVSTEMILRGFKTVFKEHDDVPKHVMLDPFLDQLILNLKQHKTGENLMTTLELEFLTDIIRDHGQVLQEDTALLMLEYFHGVAQTRPYLTNAMSLPEHVGSLVFEHKERSMGIMRFIEQTIVPQTLSQLIAIKREEIAYSVANPLSAQNVKKGRSPKKGSKGHKLLLAKDKELAADRRLKRFNIISLIDKLHQVMQGVRNQDNLVDQVRSTMQRYQEAFQSTSTGIQHLLEKWDVEVDSFRNRQAMVPALYSSESDEASKRIVAIASDNMSAEELSQRINNKNKKKELDWAKVKDPSNKIALRAVEEFQALKQKRIEKQNKDRLEEAKKRQKEDRMKSQAKLEVAKRGMMLERDSMLRQQKLKAIFSGNQENSTIDPGLQSIQQPRSILAQQVGPKRSTSLAQLSSKIGVQETAVALISDTNKGPTTSLSTTANRKKNNILVDFEGTEEDREKDSVKLILQRYTTLFRFLFDKYTAKSDFYKKQNPRNRTLSEKVISIADLMKMYREHNMDHSMLNKHELQLLMSQINEKLLKPYNDDALNFAGFVQCFWQSAIYCHNQKRFKAPHETGGKPISSLLFGEMINNLVTWFKLAAQSRGHQTVLYDYPELVKEPQRANQLAQLNKRLKDNPGMSLDLPTGFVLSKEMEQVTEYGIPPSARKTIGEPKVIALEILDELLSKCIGVRLFEPQISMREAQVVKVSRTSGEVSSRSGATSVQSKVPNSDRLVAPPEYSIGTPKAFGSNKLSTDSYKKGSIRSLAQISTVQTILQNQVFDDQDIYGLGFSSSDQNKSESSQPHLKALDIYKTDNILRIKEKHQLRQYGIPDNSSVQLSRHRAHQLAPIGSTNHSSITSTGSRALTQVRSVNDLAASKRKASRATRLNENLLLQTGLSADLKAATYEYQLSKTDERDLEPIRQTALVLEDMLQVLSGGLPKYPYGPKKIVKPLKALQEQQQRAHSLVATKNRNSLQIKQRLPPGEYKSNLAKMRIDQMKQQEQEKLASIEKSEVARIKRALQLKKKLAVQNNSQLSGDDLKSRAHSEQAYGGKNLGESQSKSDKDSVGRLDNINVVDPSAAQIGGKKLQQLRAKQLKQAQAEREARKKKHTEDGLALMAQEKAERQRAALISKQNIEQSIARRQEYIENESQIVRKANEDLKVRQQQRGRSTVNQSASVERLTKPAYKQVQNNLGSQSVPKSPALKKVNKFSAQQSLEKQRKQQDKIARQKMEVYIKKERQEVLAFYLRPDVQTVVAEYDEQLGKLYEKIVGARDSLDRDTKRMTQDGYVSGFGETAKLVPSVLSVRDLGLIFDTVVNERVDHTQHNDSFDESGALADMGGSLSFEEFKKSIIRVASLCTATNDRIRMSPNEVQDDQDRLLETSGGEAPAEWDEFGNPIKYRTVIRLKKIAIPPVDLEPGRVPKDQPKMYDISKLKLEKFHKVLHYIVNNIKGKQPNYVQPASSSARLDDSIGATAADPFIQIQQQNEVREETEDVAQTFGMNASLGESKGYQLATMKEALAEAEDTMMDSQKLPVRDDLDDDDDDDSIGRQQQHNSLAASQGYDLTLGEQQLVNIAANKSLGAQSKDFKNSLSSRRQDGTSDGHFSDYNEVLKSPKKANQAAGVQALNSGSVNLLESSSPSPRLGNSTIEERNGPAEQDTIQDDYD